ncbi:MAG: hypothetical protein ACJ74H_00225 [Thermoanaerobaculia bacterium]
MLATFYYSLQQRLLASDCELPFLSPRDPDAEPEIVLQLAARSASPQVTESWYRGPSLIIDRTAEGDLVVRFEDGTAFLVRADSIAFIDAPAAYTRDDIAAYALGPVIAIALHLQGAVLLHASSVVMREKAVVFAGPSGSGKSTTAAILHRLGYPVLSDDVTELAGTRALASLPAMRLWPDVVHALFGANAVFPDRAPSWDKKLVVIAQAPPAEIAAVLFLDERANTPRLTRLAPREAWRRLIANVYTAMLPGDAMARRIFDATSALADDVPMYSFAPPPVSNADELGEFLERELC